MRHPRHAAQAAERIRRTLDPARLVGMSVSGVIAEDRELPAEPAVSILALAADGLEARGFTDRTVDTVDPRSPAVLIFADPATLPVSGMLRGFAPGTRVIGGLASASSASGGNALILDDAALDAGAVGVEFSGPIRFDPVVAQACRPIGKPFVVTQARANLLMRLGGRSALEIARETARESVTLAPKAAARPQSPERLCLGVAIDEHKPNPGRGDFVVHRILGVDEPSGSIAVEHAIRAGRTVQFHARDESVAADDLALLLDGQQLHGPPAASLMFASGIPRSRPIPGPPGPAAVLQRAFRSPTAGEELARAGTPVAPAATDTPLAGGITSGEIGPLVGQARSYSQTCTAGVIRFDRMDDHPDRRFSPGP